MLMLRNHVILSAKLRIKLDLGYPISYEIFQLTIRSNIFMQKNNLLNLACSGTAQDNTRYQLLFFNI